VRETLRLALEELDKELAVDERPPFWAELWERYVENKLDYKGGADLLKAKHRQSGMDVQRLLSWVEPMRGEARYASQVELLREVFAQQYEVKEAQVEAVTQHASGVVRNPHDPDAQWSAKGTGQNKKSWVGYKVQVAESMEEEAQKDKKSKRFITSVVTQKARESDDVELELTLEDQARNGLERPTELYVDGAYVSGGYLKEAQTQGYQLMGPAQPSANRAHIKDEYRIEAFKIDIAKREAVCPGGYLNTQCSRLEQQARGRVDYRFEWSTHCRDSVLKPECVPATQKHRTIVVGENHNLLRERRIEQRSDEFKLQMYQRNGIEGALSELTRAHAMRRSRYRGFAKVESQNLLIGAACNIKRWLRVLRGEIAVALPT
jgi:hypothetical protein